jgi:hypothetical protein
MKRVATILFSIIPSTVFAHIVPGEVLGHSGHLPHAQAHSFFHSEYIFILLAIVALVYAVDLIRHK